MTGNLLHRPLFVVGAILTLLALYGFTCPPKLVSKGGGEVSDSRYHIEYGSWVKDDEQPQNYLCNCVRNLGTQTVHIDWPAANLRGWAKLNFPFFGVGTIASPDVETRMTDLHYGNSVVQVPTRFAIAQPQHASTDRPAAITLLPASTRVVAQSDSYSERQLTQISEGQISVPSDSVATGRSFEEIDALVQDNPDLLQDIAMTFTSTAQLDASGNVTAIEYNCTYSVDNATPETSLSFRIDDDRVNKAVFDHEGVVHVDWNNLAGGVPFDATGSIDVGSGSADIRTRATSMSFVDFDGNVLGSMPINVLTAG